MTCQKDIFCSDCPFNEWKKCTDEERTQHIRGIKVLRLKEDSKRWEQVHDALRVT